MRIREPLTTFPDVRFSREMRREGGTRRVQPTTMGCHRKSGKGFALIEVVVSIFVIGSMIIASAALLGAVPANRLARNQSIAVAVAQNQMESLRAAGYAALPASGPFNDTELSALSSGAGSIAIAVYDEETKRIDVSVSWEEEAGPQAVTLTTLITETGGL